MSVTVPTVVLQGFKKSCQIHTFPHEHSHVVTNLFGELHLEMFCTSLGFQSPYALTICILCCSFPQLAVNV